jgi:GrpB-like predicted nucleotidyltransferase (UPF0157 family)
MLGLKHDVNLLVNYDPTWELEFVVERKRLAVALGTVAKGIEHYGSTAVPGMRAKPILDILVGVSSLDEWEKCKVPLEALGYDYAGRAFRATTYLGAAETPQSGHILCMLSNFSENHGPPI